MCNKKAKNESIKHEMIIEAATKRFIRFGFNKTTYAEIARDLGVTQQSLYYYFADKTALILAVAENIISEYLDLMQYEVEKCTNFKDKLLTLIKVREVTFEKYSMLSLDPPQESFIKNPAVTKLIAKTKARQLAIVKNVLEEGQLNGQCKPVDANTTSNLLISTIEAQLVALKQTCAIPDRSKIKKLFKQQKDLVEIFASGLNPCTEQ